MTYSKIFNFICLLLILSPNQSIAGSTPIKKGAFQCSNFANTSYLPEFWIQTLNEGNKNTVYLESDNGDPVLNFNFMSCFVNNEDNRLIQCTGKGYLYSFGLIENVSEEQVDFSVKTKVITTTVQTHLQTENFELFTQEKESSYTLITISQQKANNTTTKPNNSIYFPDLKFKFKYCKWTVKN